MVLMLLQMLASHDVFEGAILDFAVQEPFNAKTSLLLLHCADRHTADHEFSFLEESSCEPMWR